jgi:hypothetical protein
MSIFITEDQAYKDFCRSQFLDATPYNKAVLELRNFRDAKSDELNYLPVTTFKVPSLKTGRNKKWFTDGNMVWSKGYFVIGVEMVLSGNAYNEKLGCEYDVQKALVKLNNKGD